MGIWPAYADVATVASRDMYGVEVVITPQATGVPETIQMPFDRRWIEAGSAADSPGSDLASVLDVRLLDMTVAPAQDDPLTVNGIAYVIDDVQATGNGDAKLFLKRA